MMSPLMALLARGRVALELGPPASVTVYAKGREPMNHYGRDLAEACRKALAATTKETTR